MSQLTLDDAVERPNPNAHMLDREGQPRRLMWCSDGARLGRGCPYLGERARFRPAGGCCVELVGLSQDEIDERAIAERKAAS